MAPLPIAAAHRARLQFERVAGYIIAGLVGIYGVAGLYSDAMAARIVTLAPALTQLATVLGAVMGASWFRGHMDQRISQDNDNGSS